MKIIAAYPCLGKTTIYKLNKDRCFDCEFNESRAAMQMNEGLCNRFFNYCAEIIKLETLAGYYDIIFITDDDRLISKLEKTLRDFKNNVIFVFPDTSDDDVMKEYKSKVIKRSGIDWYNKVLLPEACNLNDRVNYYKECGYDVRLTDLEKRYIEDVVDFPDDFIFP